MSRLPESYAPKWAAPRESSPGKMADSRGRPAQHGVAKIDDFRYRDSADLEHAQLPRHTRAASHPAKRPLPGCENTAPSPEW